MMQCPLPLIKKTIQWFLLTCTKVWYKGALGYCFPGGAVINQIKVLIPHEFLLLMYMLITKVVEIRKADKLVD